MKIKTVKTAEEGAQIAFAIIRDAMKANAIRVLGLATGSTPIPLYRLLTESNLDFRDMVSVNLDEYVGLDPSHPQSYHAFMDQYLFDAKPFRNSYIPDGLNQDEANECARYETILQDNPIDIQILGLGANGHIGFNEPGSSFDSLTRKVALAASTIAANARFFPSADDVPKFAYSMGIASILCAKKIILFAFGEEKAQAVHELIIQDPNTAVPATALKNHDDLLIIVDEAAATLLD